MRGGGAKESFFAEGKHEPTGYLFNETPTPPGQTRKWESWEAPWYVDVISIIDQRNCFIHFPELRAGTSHLVLLLPSSL